VLRFLVHRELVWTEASEDHIAAHGVRPAQVEDAVNGRPVLVLQGRNDTTELYGTTREGRALLVILAPALDGRWYVVTARDMTSSERRAFRRKGR
jgi:uncharacterized DUF497 family protein